MWRRNWEYLTPFFAYPADIGKVIYTTNAVESLNMCVFRANPISVPKASRSRFRSDADRDSDLKAITVPT
jgi:transposase-like protein